MTNNNQEIESKFYVYQLDTVEKLLLTIGAICIVPRQFEYNLRFDNDNNSLQEERKVLRLRRYDDNRLTYKGPGVRLDGALSRTEIELVVDDFNQARLFLESLGYHVVAIYEKYRSMFKLGNSLITLDELPYGKFVEIEAENTTRIREITMMLGLNPNCAIAASYQGLFEAVKVEKKLPVNNLTFDDFSNIQISPEDLHVKPSDQQ